MRDSDSSTYEKTAGWEKEYINSFMKEAKSGKYDFIFVCQTESVIDEMDRQKIPYVIVEPDNIVCWLTRYEKPVKVQKLWLVGGEVVLWPYIVDGVVYDYPIVRNSIWTESKALPDPEFQNQIKDITQKWLNEA